MYFLRYCSLLCSEIPNLMNQSIWTFFSLKSRKIQSWQIPYFSITLHGNQLKMPKGSKHLSVSSIWWCLPSLPVWDLFWSHVSVTQTCETFNSPTYSSHPNELFTTLLCTHEDQESHTCQPAVCHIYTFCSCVVLQLAVLMGHWCRFVGLWWSQSKSHWKAESAPDWQITVSC